MTDVVKQQSRLKALIAKGKEQGYLTYAEVNDHLPQDISDPDQVEDIIQMINDMGIQVFEAAPDADELLMSEGDSADDIAAAEAALSQARQMMESGEYDLIVLDEINISLRYDQIAVEPVIAALEARSPKTGVILTGRNAPQEIVDYADLVTVMEEVKHPYTAGIKAQRGVDF